VVVNELVLRWDHEHATVQRNVLGLQRMAGESLVLKPTMGSQGSWEAMPFFFLLLPDSRVVDELARDAVSQVARAGLYLKNGKKE